MRGASLQARGRTRRRPAWRSPQGPPNRDRISGTAGGRLWGPVPVPGPEHVFSDLPQQRDQVKNTLETELISDEGDEVGAADLEPADDPLAVGLPEAKARGVDEAA